jgi:hypothetical protein
MRRVLLVVSMLVSLWPVGFIGVSFATASKHSRPTSESVTVTVPSTAGAPTTAKENKATIPLSSDGKTYYCPAGTANKLHPIDERAGGLQLELTSVRRSLAQTIGRLKELDKLYPGHTAPTQAIVNEYNGLLRKGRALDARENRLVRAYNDAVDAHNQILRTDCS